MILLAKVIIKYERGKNTLIFHAMLRAEGLRRSD